MTTSYNYDSEFFDYIDMGSRRSAHIVIQFLLNQLPITSVLDVGCGRGIWLDEWQQLGVTDIFGVDGDYVELDKLEVPRECFQASNLADSLTLDRKFDLVQSLEVAEHIPAQYADTFVQNLIGHGDIILFSAAPPGQGGEFHVNEQDYSYWRDKFANYGYQLIDLIRPQLVQQAQVEPWYRYNTLLFVNGNKISTLPRHVQTALWDIHQPVKDWAPLLWQVRRAVLSRLPTFLVDGLVAVKHSLVLTFHRLKQ